MLQRAPTAAAAHQRPSAWASAPLRQTHTLRCRNHRRALGSTAVVARSSSGGQQQQASSSKQHDRKFHEGLTLTAYEGNSFAVKFNQCGAFLCFFWWVPPLAALIAALLAAHPPDARYPHDRAPAPGARVLVDPWLVQDLTFFDQAWAYVGRKKVLGPGRVNVDEVASETDLILLSQVGAAPEAAFFPSFCHVAAWQFAFRKKPLIPFRPSASSPTFTPQPQPQPHCRSIPPPKRPHNTPQYLDDHTHMPTLKSLPKSIPIIAQPEAAARIAPLGFTDVRTLAPGQALEALGGRLRVRATAGALVGPPWSARQNGFVVEEVGVARPARLYYEPHCGALGWGRGFEFWGGGLLRIGIGIGQDCGLTVGCRAARVRIAAAQPDSGNSDAHPAIMHTPHNPTRARF